MAIDFRQKLIDLYVKRDHMTAQEATIKAGGRTEENKSVKFADISSGVEEWNGEDIEYVYDVIKDGV